MKRIAVFVMIVLCLGAVLAVAGILLLTLAPQLINKEVSKRTFLGFDGNGTYNEMTKKWISPPYAMEMAVWVYSLNNEDDVVKRGASPNFTQKGPYAFVERQKKTKVLFMANDTRVVYRNKHVYFFNANRSCSDCDLNDNVTIPNVVYQIIVDYYVSAGWMTQRAINLFLKAFKRESPFVTVKVHEMLFDGYKDSLIRMACDSKFRLFCDLLHLPAKIGFFYGQNDTDDGEYMVDSGRLRARNISQVYEYNGMTEMPSKYWSSHEACMINGTDGQLYSPNLPRSKDLHLFIGQLKRSIYMRYKKDVEFRGVPAIRFVLPAELYDSRRPDNNGFCNPKSTRFFNDTALQPEGCLPYGLLDISRTKPGEPPIYLSAPHFLNCPSEVSSDFVDFPKPVVKYDESYLDIEQTSGVLIYAKQLMQINVGMQSCSLSGAKNMKSMIAPVLWINETARFDAATRQELLNNLISVKHKVFILGIACATLGGLLWIAFILIFVIHKYVSKRSEEGQPLIVQEDSETEDPPE